MKCVKRAAKTVFMDVYIADDGMEFDSELKCREYERHLEMLEAKKRIGALPHFELSLEFGPDTCEHTWTWYFISSEDDLNAVKISYFEADCSARTFELDFYPKWIVVMSNGNGYGAIEGVSEILRQINDFKDAVMKKFMEPK